MSSDDMVKDETYTWPKIGLAFKIISLEQTGK